MDHMQKKSKQRNHVWGVLSVLELHTAFYNRFSEKHSWQTEGFVGHSSERRARQALVTSEAFSVMCSPAPSEGAFSESRSLRSSSQQLTEKALSLHVLGQLASQALTVPHKMWCALDCFYAYGPLDHAYKLLPFIRNSKYI